MNSKKPRFIRVESHRYKRLKNTWRKPTGHTGKLRLHKIGNRRARPVIGYGNRADLRGLHPSGLQEVLVETPSQLEGLDPAVHAVRIAGRVGSRKKALITEKAAELGLKVLNPARKKEA